MKKPQKMRKTKKVGGVLVNSQPSVFARTTARPELKFAGASDQNIQLYHNVAYNVGNTTNLLDAIGQGGVSNQRIGNRITLKRISLRILLNNKADRTNVSYRITGVLCPATAVQDSFSELFSVSGSNITATPIPGTCVVLFDRTIGGGNSSVTAVATTTKERSFFFNFAKELSGDVVYVNGYCSTRLAIFVNCYDAYGSITTDNIASIPASYVGMYFTDT